MLLQFSVE